MAQNNISSPAFLFEQPVGAFYVGKMNYKTLINMCSKDIEDIKREQGAYDIYQRKLDKKRIPSLKAYMEYSKATFPNGIILNSRYPVQFHDNTLTVRNEKNTFFIIDGQHRIEALKYYSGTRPFDICVVIFEKIDIDLQTDIFATVNNEQKKVNPTIKINLRGTDRVDTPEKVVRKLAIAFNDNDESPFKERIIFSDEVVGRDELKISLAAFIRPIIANIYPDTNSYLIKDCLYLNNNDRKALTANNISFKKIFWDYYVQSEEEIIYLMLLNYFTAVMDLLPIDWNDNKALLSKTSGYNALMKLFVDVLKHSPTDMSYDTLYSILKPLSKCAGHFKVDEIGVGNSASIRLYKKFAILLGYLDSTSREGFYFSYDEEE